MYRHWDHAPWEISMGADKKVNIARRFGLFLQAVKQYILIASIGVLISGCATHAELNAALIRVDEFWKQKDEELRRQFGTAAVDATTDESFEAMLNGMRTLGFSIKNKDHKSGLIYGVAPAPTPLNEEEWQKVKDVDGPEMREIVGQTLPLTSLLFFLHADEADVNVLASVRPLSSGSEVSFTYTIVDHKALNMGLYGSESPSPTAARIALIKAWKVFEKELAKVQARK